MKDAKVRLQLEQLKEIKPDAEWKQKQRNLLLWQICPDDKKSSWSELFLKVLVSRSFLTSSISAVAVILLIVSGSLATYSSAQESLPGDNLYQVKVTLEQARIALSFSTDEKTKLEVDRVGRRAQELGKVMEKLAQEKNKNTDQQIDKALLTLKNGVSKVRTMMDEVSKEKKSGEVVAMAKYVDGKIKDYRNNLTRTTQDIPGELDSQIAGQINETLNMFDEASLEVVAVAVDQVLSQKDYVQEEIKEVSQLIDSKISETQLQVADLELDNAKVERALIAIELAKKYLSQNDLKPALDAVKEAHLLIQEAQVTLSAESGNDETQNNSEERIEEVQGVSTTSTEQLNDEEIKSGEDNSTTTPIVPLINTKKLEQPVIEFKMIIGR